MPELEEYRSCIMLIPQQLNSKNVIVYERIIKFALKTEICVIQILWLCGQLL